MKLTKQHTLLASTTVVLAVGLLWWHESPGHPEEEIIIGQPKSIPQSVWEAHGIVQAPATAIARPSPVPIPDSQAAASAYLPTSAIDLVVSEYEGASYKTRSQGLRKLGAKPTPQEIERLYDFLHSTDYLSDLNPSAFRGFYDRVMTYLDKLDDYPQGYVEALIDVIENTEHEYTMRDYAIQHLSRQYELREGLEFEQALSVLWDATNETNTTVAGTSLLALYRSERIGSLSEQDKDRLTKTTFELALDRSADSSVRTTALQVAASKGIDAILPEALGILADPDSPTALKLSAISAIGQLGDAASLDALVSHTAHNSILTVAANEAIVAIKSRSDI